MIDVLGLELKDAESIFKEHDISYTVVKTYSPKKLADADSARVVRQRLKSDSVELTVGYFKTKI